MSSYCNVIFVVVRFDNDQRTINPRCFETEKEAIDYVTTINGGHWKIEKVYQPNRPTKELYPYLKY